MTSIFQCNIPSKNKRKTMYSKGRVLTLLFYKIMKRRGFILRDDM